MTYITGDRHGNFQDIVDLCEDGTLSAGDTLIVLGDAGINYYVGKKDEWVKERLAELPITLFCIHGNHEIRPQNISSYKEKTWNGGTVFVEDRFPNLLFAKDSELFVIGNRQCLVIGGAYSVDKYYRIARNLGWWDDEQPSPEIKTKVENKIKELGGRVEVVLSHTAPLIYEPTEAFIEGLDQSEIDKSTEEWLDQIEENLDYNQWFCGHYHIEKKIDRLRFLYKSIVEFDKKDIDDFGLGGLRSLEV